MLNLHNLLGKNATEENGNAINPHESIYRNACAGRRAVVAITFPQAPAYFTGCPTGFASQLI
jgi:hypothetical protein